LIREDKKGGRNCQRIDDESMVNEEKQRVATSTKLLDRILKVFMKTSSAEVKTAKFV
jgi:hypothetical protein